MAALIPVSTDALAIIVAVLAILGGRLLVALYRRIENLRDRVAWLEAKVNGRPKEG